VFPCVDVPHARLVLYKSPVCSVCSTHPLSCSSHVCKVRRIILASVLNILQYVVLFKDTPTSNLRAAMDLSRQHPFRQDVLVHHWEPYDSSPTSSLLPLLISPPSDFLNSFRTTLCALYKVRAPTSKYMPHVVLPIASRSRHHFLTTFTSYHCRAYILATYY
jgi:hypothetical protein